MLKPIGDHILVKPLPQEEVTKSGIVLPDSAQEKPHQGKIVAVGSGKYIGDKLHSFAELGINDGDVIMFSKYGPTEIKVDGEEYYILESNDVLGVVASAVKETSKNSKK